MGIPVDPEVRRILATVSGPTDAVRAASSGPGPVRAQSARLSVPAAPAALTTVRPSRSRAASAASNGAGSSTKTAEGSLRSMTKRNLAWSFDISE